MACGCASHTVVLRTMSVNRMVRMPVGTAGRGARTGVVRDRRASTVRTAGGETAGADAAPSVVAARLSRSRVRSCALPRCPMQGTAGLPLLAGGEAPSRAGKRKRRRVLQPGKPGRCVHGNRAGIVCRENQRGAIYLCGRAHHASAFRYELRCVRDVMVRVYGGWGKCASRVGQRPRLGERANAHARTASAMESSPYDATCR